MLVRRRLLCRRCFPRHLVLTVVLRLLLLVGGRLLLIRCGALGKAATGAAESLLPETQPGEDEQIDARARNQPRESHHKDGRPRRKLAARAQPSTVKDVPAHRFDVFAVPLLLTILAPVALLAQTSPAPQAPEPVPTEVRTPPPPATPPDSVTAGIFPLDQVHRGQHGVAYTVFEGVVPSAVEVEILGVLHNALGPHQDMILARLGGKDAVYTGVVAGMSGSPVYIDGKLAGALAFRIGQFSKEPIAGITPIQQMLEVKDMPDGGSTPVNTGTRPGNTSGNAEIRPIETPLLFSGFSQQAVDAFKDRFTAQGLTPVVGLGGGSSTEKQPEPIEPGSSVSALLVRGDMEIAATCTATYVDKNQLLACGHPITQTGSVSVPMTKAEVVATLPSPLNAFKIVNTTEEVGAFTQDRQTAIRGEFGAKAHMVPVTVTFHDGSDTRAVHFEVVDSPDLTPLLMLTSIYQSMMQSNSYAARDHLSNSGARPVRRRAGRGPDPFRRANNRHTGSARRNARGRRATGAAVLESCAARRAAQRLAGHRSHSRPADRGDRKCGTRGRRSACRRHRLPAGNVAALARRNTHGRHPGQTAGYPAEWSGSPGRERRSHRGPHAGERRRTISI